MRHGPGPSAAGETTHRHESSSSEIDGGCGAASMARCSGAREQSLDRQSSKEKVRLRLKSDAGRGDRWDQNFDSCSSSSDWEHGWTEAKAEETRAAVVEERGRRGRNGGGRREGLARLLERSIDGGGDDAER